MTRFLLCTDLDRTLLPNGAQAESPGAREYFARLADLPGLALAYVSGRHLELVEHAIAQWQLPRPAHVIADVGTTIWHADDAGLWQQDPRWQEELVRDWSGWRSSDLVALCEGIGPLRLQPAERQGRHKLSFTFAPAEAPTRLCAQLLALLEQHGVRARAVASIDDNTGEGLLDILPRCASKRHAIERLMEHLAIDLDATVFCGDSGNDLEVLTSAIPSVLVANASDEVRRAALEGAASKGQQSALFIARGGFLGMNGNYAGGILEGVAHFHPCTRPLLEGSRA